MQCKPGHLTEQDKRQGWRERIVYLGVGDPPPGHGITIHTDVELAGLPEVRDIKNLWKPRSPGTFEGMDSIRCDACGADCTGQICYAVTHMPPGKIIADWEHEFGTVLPEEAVILYQNIK
jgi:hypothetical protein